ncbi:MAG: Fic family protein [Candidatus Margulisbacteria bacterium]|nr:Fic family protein [Candidatus Margulisiibacteriota bacterium]
MIKKWNWQQKEWPRFSYDPTKIQGLETLFTHNTGLYLGVYKHIGETDKTTLIVNLEQDEALKTSEIEGDYLDRDSLQASIRQNFGLGSDGRQIPPAEKGISDMLVDLYTHFSVSLSHDILFKWHQMVMSGKTHITTIGSYRSHDDPMQVVSGPIHKPNIHFEAPPSSHMNREMSAFITWFNDTAPDGKHPMTPLLRASIAHLYFLSIHPFEDGNGRIGRALVEKCLSQAMGQPTLIALSNHIASHRKAYYDALEKNNKDSQIDDWISYFATTILDAQSYTINYVEFFVHKAKFFDQFHHQMNDRQHKVIKRIFQEGLSGFKGGLSAKNYIRITRTSHATATRDLQDLCAKNIFNKTGIGKGTRYHLNISQDTSEQAVSS